jgi:hypothetical protein
MEFTDKCVEWPYRKDKDGYGVFAGAGERHVTAARLMYQLFVGPIPDGLHVLHHCDNRACCNPAHLFVGTHLDNMNDRDSKGRNLRPDGWGANTKADPELVAAIRDGAISFSEAAQKGVSRSSYYRFRLGANQKLVER